jgi:hypothetical protein
MVSFSNQNQQADVCLFTFLKIGHHYLTRQQKNPNVSKTKSPKLSQSVSCPVFILNADTFQHLR